MSQPRNAKALPAHTTGAAFCALTFAAAIALCVPALASDFSVIHDFTGGADGGVPGYTLTPDGKGNFLGNANQGGAGYGVVFRLQPRKKGWTVKPLYDFTDQDGQPGWGVTLRKGSLYTNASYSEVMGGPCGSALKLDPAKAPSARLLTSTLLHTYVKSADGCPTGNLTVDKQGDIFGVTQDGGAHGWGSVFELSYSGSAWTQTILYSFTGGEDGGAPYSELIEDAAGNLYGTASACQSGCQGTAFELSPSKSGWTYKVLHAFTGGDDGGQPVAALTFDKAGNLFGATTSFGTQGGGTIFSFSPKGKKWTFSVLADLTGSDGPVAALALDPAGNIYGTNFMDGADGYGSVFSLTKKGNGWSYTDLHDFTGGSDGGYPGGGVVLDSNGNLYGTAVLGGANSLGVIYKIKP